MELDFGRIRVSGAAIGWCLWLAICSELHKKLGELSKDSAFLSDVNKNLRETDKRTIKPIPETTNHEYGWIPSLPDFKLEKYGADVDSPAPLPETYHIFKGWSRWWFCHRYWYRQYTSVVQTLRWYLISRNYCLFAWTVITTSFAKLNTDVRTPFTGGDKSNYSPAVEYPRNTHWWWPTPFCFFCLAPKRSHITKIHRLHELG